MRYLPSALLVSGIAVMLVIVGCRGTKQETTTPSAVHADTGGSVRIAADEAACPVMGTIMKKSQMTSVTHNGKTYYLCCSACIGKFTANAEKYLANPAPAGTDAPEHHGHH